LSLGRCGDQAWRPSALRAEPCASNDNHIGGVVGDDQGRCEGRQRSLASIESRRFTARRSLPGNWVRALEIDFDRRAAAWFHGGSLLFDLVEDSSGARCRQQLIDLV
jgi:hypothetical protein